MPGRAGSTVDLERDFDPGRADHNLGKENAELALEEAKGELFALQDRFYAQSDRALLVVLQGIDAAGKDGTIKHVISGVNPEGWMSTASRRPAPPSVHTTTSGATNSSFPLWEESPCSTARTTRT